MPDAALMAQPAPQEPTDPKMMAKSQAAVDAKVPPKIKPMYDRIVVAGKQLMFSQKTHSMMVQRMSAIKDPSQVPGVIQQGIMEIIILVLKQSGRPLNLADPFYPASIMAAHVLAFDALEYVEEELKIPVSTDLIAQTIEAVTAKLFSVYGVTKQKADQAVATFQQSKGKPQLRDVSKGAPEESESDLDEEEQP